MPQTITLHNEDGTDTPFVPYIEPAPEPDPAPVVTRAFGPRSNFSKLGVNLDQPTSSSTFHLFIDAMRQARPIGLHVGPLEQVVFVEQVAADGSYILLCENPDVTVTTFNSGAAKVEAPVSFAGVYSATVTVPPGQKQLFLRYSVHPGKVQLLRPGYELHQAIHQIFTDAALAQMAPFGRIRTMDLLGTNASPVTTWESRNSHLWTPEDCVALANVAGKDLYLNVPHAADDGYVAELRKLVESTLNPALACYVEYSNEIAWNTAPPFNVQRNYALGKAREAIAAGDVTISAPDANGNVNETYALWRWIARRTVEIAKLLGPRFRVILAGQDANTQVCKVQLAYIAAHQGAPANFLFAYSTAPYMYSLKSELARTDLTPPSYLALLSAAVDYNANKQAEHRAMCNTHSLRYVGYEAQSHDHESGSPDAVLDGQMLPAAETIYRTYWQNRRRFFDECYIFSLSARRYWKDRKPNDPLKSVQQFGMLPGTHSMNTPGARAAVAAALEWNN